MAKNFINNFDIDFKCPNCNKTLKINSNQIGTQITCKYCNQNIDLEDDGFSYGLNDVNKQLDKFTKDLKKMFK